MSTPPAAVAAGPAAGTLAQLRGAAGCLAERSSPTGGCAPARGLGGPGPFLGSHAIAIDPKGASVYVASSNGNAIAIFSRNAKTGRLTQASGTSACVAAGGADGCADGLGLRGPNSVAVSPDGRSVYATSIGSEAVAVFHRSATGALTQAKDGSGCLSGVAIPGCTLARALVGPDVVGVSADGRNVYVGSFFGNAVAVLTRDTTTGNLTQPAGTAGCIGGAAADGCAPALAISSPEGLAISADGASVYVAAAVSNAVAVLVRDPATGALTQATGGSGCIVDAPLAGCTTGTQLAGANAVAISPDDDDVYVTSLTSNSVTSFTRTAGTGALTQKSGTSACVVFLLANGCSLGRSLGAPEGLAVSPDGADVYATAFRSGAVDTLGRTSSGTLMQASSRAGCIVMHAASDCTLARALKGASSAVVSPDGRNLYSTAFTSNAVGVFSRTTGSSR